MQASLHRTVAMLMLILFLISNGLYMFNAKKLAHDLDLTPQALIPAVNQQPPYILIQTGKHTELLTVIEHQLLHVAEHLQIFLVNRHLTRLGFFTSVIPKQSLVWALPQIQLDPPLRPPKASSLA